MGEVLPLVGEVITQCSAWFLEILNKVEGLEVWFTAVLVSLSYKYLLSPIFGRARSDLASQSYNAFKRRKEK